MSCSGVDDGWRAGGGVDVPMGYPMRSNAQKESKMHKKRGLRRAAGTDVAAGIITNLTITIMKFYNSGCGAASIGRCSRGFRLWGDGDGVSQGGVEAEAGEGVAGGEA